VLRGYQANRWPLRICVTKVIRRAPSRKKIFLNRSAIASLRIVRIKPRILFKTFTLSEYCLVNV